MWHCVGDAQYARVSIFFLKLTRHMPQTDAADAAQLPRRSKRWQCVATPGKRRPPPRTAKPSRMTNRPPAACFLASERQMLHRPPKTRQLPGVTELGNEPFDVAGDDKLDTLTHLDLHSSSPLSCVALSGHSPVPMLHLLLLSEYVAVLGFF